MRKFKKILTIIISACIFATCSVCSVTATAAEETSEEDTTSVTVSENTDETKKYDWSSNTSGNSDLIASQQILLENGEYQFIAVSTFTDDVFYIIIDKTKTEDNVYFLNQVDTYDIMKLIDDDDDDSSSSTSSNEDVEETTTVVNENESSQSNETDNSNLYLLIFVGIAFIGAVVFALFKLSKKKKTTSNEEDDYSFADEDEEEINEDKE
jgi:hypothetical protein